MGNPYGSTQIGPTYLENMPMWVLYALFLDKPHKGIPILSPYWTNEGNPEGSQIIAPLEKKLRELYVHYVKFYIM